MCSNFTSSGRQRRPGNVVLYGDYCQCGGALGLKFLLFLRPTTYHFSYSVLMDAGRWELST